jgi:hypothetical protein
MDRYEQLPDRELDAMIAERVFGFDLPQDPWVK